MKSFFFIMLVGVLAACSPQIQVYSDSDPDYDLWTYKTFDWGKKVNIEEGANPLHYNELNDKRIKAAVLDQMISRGYRLSSDHPDLIVHYHIIIKDKSVVAPEPYGYRYGPYWMRAQTNLYYYREGTLILDLMETTTHNLIWRGWGVAAIDEVNPDQVDDLIKRAVSEIFKKYPKAVNKSDRTQHVVSQ